MATDPEMHAGNRCATEEAAAPEEASRALPRILFCCDFPPSSGAGGPILVARLLERFAPDSLVVIFASRYTRQAAEGRLNCPHRVWRSTRGRGRWGLGYVKIAWDWLAVPLVAVFAAVTALRRRAEAIATVAHGNFFVAAMLASMLTRRPLILFVHDDWVEDTRRGGGPLGLLAPAMFRAAVRQADRVYVVSPFLQEELRARYGVEARLHLPATSTRPAADGARRDSATATRLVFAGAMTAAVNDTLQLVIAAMEQAPEVELHLYTHRVPELQRPVWQHPRVIVHDWVTQAELPAVLRAADLLLLPFSFAESQRRTVERGFPSKTADYLASGKPVLVVGPEYSSIARFVRQTECAVLVTEPEPAGVVSALRRLTDDPAYREALLGRARATLDRYHDLESQRTEFAADVQQLARGSGKR